jgi:hypothetical protein
VGTSALAASTASNAKITWKIAGTDRPAITDVVSSPVAAA